MISDRQLAGALSRVVDVANPVVSAIATADPFGLRARTKRTEPQPGGSLDAVADVAAWILDAVSAPGTRSWERMTPDERSRWWVVRIGAVNNVLVAFPGVFGALVNRLPIQNALAYGNQAIVLVAIAREHGVRDRDEQVRMLAKVLSDRVIYPAALEVEPDGEASRRAVGLVKALWQTAGVVIAIPDELESRPKPSWVFQLAGMVPWVGGIAGYIGEFGALSRAADAADVWLVVSLGEAGKTPVGSSSDTVHQRLDVKKESGEQQ